MPLNLSITSNKQSFQITELYLRLLLLAPIQNLLLIILGFSLRASSVIIFALTVKVFLIAIAPDSMLLLFSKILTTYDLSSVYSLDIVSISIILLATLVIFQYLLSLFYTKLFLTNRRHLIQALIDNPISDRKEFYLHFCLDRAPAGYESIIKVLEISLFYIILLLGICLISPSIAISIVFMLIFITIFMLKKVHNKLISRKSSYKARQSITTPDSNIIDGLAFADFNFRSIRNTSIYSELLGGIAIVIVIFLYVSLFSQSQFISNNALSLLLVLSIRFVINYTGEFSRLLSLVIEQSEVLVHINLLTFNSKSKVS